MQKKPEFWIFSIIFFCLVGYLPFKAVWWWHTEGKHSTDRAAMKQQVNSRVNYEVTKHQFVSPEQGVDAPAFTGDAIYYWPNGALEPPVKLSLQNEHEAVRALATYYGSIVGATDERPGLVFEIGIRNTNTGHEYDAHLRNQLVPANIDKDARGFLTVAIVNYAEGLDKYLK
jgi:hypothetical protein